MCLKMGRRLSPFLMGIVAIFLIITIHSLYNILYLERSHRDNITEVLRSKRSSNYIDVSGTEASFPFKCDTCALIGTSGHLKESTSGSEIDRSYSCIFRLGFSPTRGYEEQVGSRTTARIVDSFRFYPFLKKPLKLATGPFLADFWFLFDRAAGDITRFHGPLLKRLLQKHYSEFFWFSRKVEKDVLNSLGNKRLNNGINWISSLWFATRVIEDAGCENLTVYGVPDAQICKLSFHLTSTMNLFLIYLVLALVSGKCLTSPFCCEKEYHYAEFMLSLKCGFSICNSNEKISGSICISCSSAVPINQNTSYTSSPASLTKPYVVCKDYEVINNVTTGHLILSWSWYGEKVFPSVFLLEARNSSRKNTKWDFVGMTKETFADVKHLSSEVEYQFRISPAISHQNAIPLVTSWISLKELRQNITAPNYIRITKFYVKDSYVEAVIKWNSSAEIPCSYTVNWIPSVGEEEFQRKTVTLAADSLSAVLSGMAFDRNYTVIISPVSFQNLRMSQSAEVWFVTPSCLNLTGGNFSICAPGPPLNLKAKWLPSNTEAEIKWLPPAYTSSTNDVLNYYIEVGEITGLFQSIIEFKDVLFVAKNCTTITISNLNTLGYYIIKVWAISEGGKGLAAATDLNVRDPRVRSLTKQQIPYYYILPVFLLLVGVVVLVAASVCCGKHLKNQGLPWGIADVDDALRRFLIPVEKVELREVVGQGAFATVHRGIYNRNKSKDDVAVKVFPAETINRHNMLHEIEILSLIGRHDNIIGFVGFTLDVEKMYLIFEYCSHGNLHNYLVTLKPELMHMRSLPPSERPSRDYGKGHALRLSSYIYQVAKGMEYISSLKLIHRDIAARNILLYDERRVKISDFGLSKDVYQTKYYSSETRKKLPIKWMAPEAIEKQRFNSSTDVWSFGVFMWEVFKLGKEPYPEIRNANILQFLKLGYRLEQPHCTKAWYDIMFSCWNILPRARPRFKELVQKIEVVMEADRTYTVLS